MKSFIHLSHNQIKYYFLILGLFIIVLVYSILMDSAVITRTIIYFLLIYCIYRGIKEPTYLNPYIFFSTVPFTLLIYSHELSTHYLLELTDKTWWFAIFNIIIFLLSLNITKQGQPKKNKSIESKKSLIFHAWFLFGLAILPYLFLYVLNWYIPFYSAIRLLIYPAISCILKSKRKIQIIVMYIVYFLIIINALDRTMLLGLMLLTIISINKYNRKIMRKQRYIIFIILAAGLLMFFMFDYRDYLRAGGDFLSYATDSNKESNYSRNLLQSGRVQWDRNQSLMLPYMYLVTPWSNLQYVMETQPAMTYGLWILKPFLGWFKIDNIFRSYYALRPYSSFNTFTFLTVHFKDFGLWGAWILTSFLGVFVKIIYNRYLLTKSPLDIATYSLIALATVQMYFSNHFFQISYPFAIVLLMFLYQKFFVRAIDTPG